MCADARYTHTHTHTPHNVTSFSPIRIPWLVYSIITYIIRLLRSRARDYPDNTHREDNNNAVRALKARRGIEITRERFHDSPNSLLRGVLYIYAGLYSIGERGIFSVECVARRGRGLFSLLLLAFFFKPASILLRGSNLLIIEVFAKSFRERFYCESMMEFLAI